MLLQDTHPSFQQSIARIAQDYATSEEEVYKRWKKYTAECRDFDQSPILMEFEQWYFRPEADKS